VDVSLGWVVLRMLSDKGAVSETENHPAMELVTRKH